MGACEWFKPDLHYFVMLSGYISLCYERYSYYVGSWDPSNVQKYFLQTKSYMKLIKSRWLNMLPSKLICKKLCMVFSIHVDEALKTNCAQLIKDKTTYIVFTKRQVIMLVKTFA